MDRIAGSLYGLAFGDALGRPTEFLTVMEIDRKFGPTGPDDLDGDPALVTDDTQMALAVAWALRGADRYTADALEPRLREQFVAWAHSAETFAWNDVSTRVWRTRGGRTVGAGDHREFQGMWREHAGDSGGGTGSPST